MAVKQRGVALLVVASIAVLLALLAGSDNSNMGVYGPTSSGQMTGSAATSGIGARGWTGGLVSAADADEQAEEEEEEEECSVCRGVVRKILASVDESKHSDMVRKCIVRVKDRDTATCRHRPLRASALSRHVVARFVRDDVCFVCIAKRMFCIAWRVRSIVHPCKHSYALADGGACMLCVCLFV